ncbi:MAG: class I fructose-bisphosphate aldolase [Actinomycetota bacterium]
MHTDTLRSTARALVAPRKGILAADESTGTIEKRFDSIGIGSSEQTRRAYRDMLLTTPALGEHISGVILFDETIRQTSLGGTPFAEMLGAAGIIPGIKVDTGAKALAGYAGETVTEGLDGLRERLAEYGALGARFAKWRATIFCGEGQPTDYALHANAHAMARYAALCQEAGIVPIVEPEVLMDGTHTIEACEAATVRTLQALFVELADAHVDVAGSLLKVNMVLSAKDCPTQAGPFEVAEATGRCLTANVPPEVPGIVFLSGGQSDEDATAHLNQMNLLGPHPWELSFSYGRALQSPALKAWGGDPANVPAGQRALAHRARMNGLARTGEYSVELEEAAA